MLKIIECPRDAMQGVKPFIDTQHKVDYIQTLLEVGFDTIDFGSFVSPQAIPQLADTAKVLSKLDLSKTKSKLLAIVANVRGANEAVTFDEINYLGFPFSISETFQQRNTNSSIAESLLKVEEMQALCVKHNKELVVYISMAFGNPYGDIWSPEIAIEWSHKLQQLGIKTLALSDTIGCATNESIQQLFSNLIPALPQVEFGAHLHSTPYTALKKIETAYEAGCRRFDVAVHGFGGCPMAADSLTGNMSTQTLMQFIDNNNMKMDLNRDKLNEAYDLAWSVFPAHD